MPYIRQTVYQSFDLKPSENPTGYGDAVSREYEISDAELKSICHEMDQFNKRRAEKRGYDWYIATRSRFFVHTSIFANRERAKYKHDNIEGKAEKREDTFVLTGLISKSIKYVDPEKLGDQQ